MPAIFKAIEQWASQSAERERLLVFLIWAALGLGVAAVFVIGAWFMLPSDVSLF